MKLLLERLTIDKAGVTFNHENKFYRAINNDAKNEVLELLKSGLIEELVQKQLFPKTWIASINIDEYELVLEHEKIDYVSYPFEWSFSMLKDAALCILEVYDICFKYGYGLHDLHNYNVIFNGCNPMFVDLGSIKKGCSFSSRVGNFLDYNYIPLKLMANGENILAKRIVSDEYIDRFLPNKKYHESHILRKIVWPLYAINYKNRIKRILNYLGLNYNFKLNFLNSETLRSIILEIKKKPIKSSWGDYHSNYSVSAKNVCSNRFEKIIELITELGITEVLDLAGNQGFLTTLIKERCDKVNNVVCLDYDENAIDTFYQNSKGKSISNNLFPIHSNIIFPIIINYFQPFNFRLKTELVLALALTHHLLLSQEFPIEFVLKQIKNLSTKFVFIEFMPLGLWGGGEIPSIPNWYTVDWFRRHFVEQFNLILEEQTEKNRILFVGTI